ncbi:MAG: uroporphyrinogen decarboxylase [Anaerolineae bacterium]|nr:uroporphyrinogen decarboxylase [Anaerolineae bacterium]
MNKRERLEKTFAGEQTDRVPVSLWRHWPGDDQLAADLARSCVEFQNAYDWDFVKVTASSNYSVTDYGVQDEWEGNLEGTRKTTRLVISRSLDWTELRPLDPTRGALGRNLESLRLIPDGLSDRETPVLMTIFSPLSQAKHLAGNPLLLRHMRTNPDRVHTGLNVLTESTLRFIDELRRTPIAGIFYAVQHASYDLMSVEEYQTFGLPYDRKILESLPSSWWFNMVHLHGQAPMFQFAAQYNAQSINWHDRDTEPDLVKGRSQITGAACGGLSQWDHVHFGTPNTIKDAVREAIGLTNSRRLIISTGCVTMITSPLSNIRAVREAVESTGA